jgi:hypothetical protein
MGELGDNRAERSPAPLLDEDHKHDQAEQYGAKYVPPGCEQLSDRTLRGCRTASTRLDERTVAVPEKVSPCRTREIASAT